MSNNEIECVHCGGHGVYTPATVRALWIDPEGHTNGKLHWICKDCLDQGDPTGPGYRKQHHNYQTQTEFDSTVEDLATIILNRQEYGDTLQQIETEYLPMMPQFSKSHFLAAVRLLLRRAAENTRR